MITRHDPLARWFLFVGSLGAAAMTAVSYVALALLRCGGGPGAGAIAAVMVAIALAQAVPAAGLVAWVLQRVPASKDWSPRALPLLALAALAVLFAAPLLLVPLLVAPLASWALATRLAAMNRPWIAVWALLSTPCLVLAGSALWLAPVLRCPR